MVKREVLKKIALELEEKLGRNHISTILRSEEIKDPKAASKTLPQLLLIVRKFDKYTLMIISNVLREYGELIGLPYIVEYKDIQGMLDSIPRSFINIKKHYLLLAGQDVMEMVKPPSYEHFRAQTELTLRSDVLNLRRDLIRVMSHQMDSQEYLKQLSIVALNAIRNYYQIIKPTLKTTEEFISKFNEDFPDGKDVLHRILKFAYSMIKGIDITEEDKLQLILSTFDRVLQPILIEIDALGLEFEKNLSKESEKLTYEEFFEKYSEEIHRLQDAMVLEFEREAKKNEHVLRGELELKFRKREQEVIKRYETEIQELRKINEDKLGALENNFDTEVEKRTKEFIEQKLAEEHQNLQDEYEDKLKKMRDNLEYKYITSDLQDKEEKLRKEYMAYEKKLRESFNLKEKAIREELEIKERNFKDSLELEFKGKLEDQKDLIRDELEIEFEESLERNLRNAQRKFETEMNRREKTLEKVLKKEFTRNEKELERQFKKQMGNKEKEIKTNLQLDFEREKLKMESKKSEAFLKLIEKEFALKYKEIERFQSDLLKAQQIGEVYSGLDKGVAQPQVTRNFIHPPESDETENEDDLFSKILNDNRMLTRGLTKKNVKKVS